MATEEDAGNRLVERRREDTRRGGRRANGPARLNGARVRIRAARLGLLGRVVGKGVGARVEREQGAFERGGVIPPPIKSSRRAGVMRSTSSTLLPLISSVSSEALAWLIAQPRPVKATSRTIPPEMSSIIVIRSPHKGFEPS